MLLPWLQPLALPHGWHPEDTSLASVCPSFFFNCFFSPFIFLFALTLSSIHLSFKSCSLPLIFSLSVWICLYLDSPTSSLQYLSQHHFSFLSDSASPHYSLCLHASSSFCPLPFSKPQPLSLCLLPALPLLSVFRTLPPLVFHFSLIHNKTGLHLERGSVRPFFLSFFCIISNHEHRPFSFILLSDYLSSSTWGK